jgi:NAD(P)-dependent dehydrogenase (short-subunit alcohol dehydrogenase family)
LTGAKRVTDSREVPDPLNPGTLFSLDGKTAVLTGAAGFLGKTMAEALLAAGARVVALGRSEALWRYADDWRYKFGDDRVRVLRLALDDDEASGEAIAEIIGSEQRIDVLVNNAHQLDNQTGFNSPNGTLERIDREQWQRHLDGGAWWAVRLIQGFGDALKSSQGSIINISSMYGIVAPSPALYAGTDKSNPPGYGAAKAAIIGVTKYVASYWGAYGVRCNAILPGPFSNIGGDSDNSVEADDPFIDRLRARTVLGRPGRPDELAGALLFLASHASSYVTGHALVVDGGWTIV